jgi:hypothetical protein
VAVALAGFGAHAALVTVFPERKTKAHPAAAEQRGLGVDTSPIVRGKGRLGIY